MIPFGGPANQVCLKDTHFPPLQAVVADRPFEKLDCRSRDDTADEILVDAGGIPDVLS